MPTIEKKITIAVSSEQIFPIISEAILAIKGELKEQRLLQRTPFMGEVNAFFPSIWGWGGMKLDVYLQGISDTETIMTLEGYIAQLATGPLKQQMDAFLSSLAAILKEKMDVNIAYEKSFSGNLLFDFEFSSWNRMDTLVIIAIIIGMGVLSVLEVMGLSNLVIVGLMGGIGYYFWRKKFRK